MGMQEVLSKIKAVKTMPELDELRTEVAEAMISGGPDTFAVVQGAFRKAKNRLKRIPLSERTW